MSQSVMMDIGLMKEETKVIFSLFFFFSLVLNRLKKETIILS